MYIDTTQVIVINYCHNPLPFDVLQKECLVHQQNMINTKRKTSPLFSLCKWSLSIKELSYNILHNHYLHKLFPQVIYYNVLTRQHKACLNTKTKLILSLMSFPWEFSQQRNKAIYVHIMVIQRGVLWLFVADLHLSTHKDYVFTCLVSHC